MADTEFTEYSEEMFEVANYGSPEYYKELFADIVIDAATGDADQDRKTAINMLQGFEQAIIEMMKYHEDSIQRYRELHGRFLLCKTEEDS